MANDNSDKNCTESKKRQGEANEQYSLGETEKNRKVERLKTVDGITERSQEFNEIGDEYEHIKDASDNYKLSLDNATQKQSKQVNYKEESIEEESDNLEENITEFQTEAHTQGDAKDLREVENKLQKSKESKSEQSDNGLPNEMLSIGGKEVKTISVLRGADTTAHFQKNVVTDSKLVEDLSNQQVIHLHKKYIEELTSKKNVSYLLHNA